MNLRAGEELIVINNKEYAIPSNILLFKSPGGQDAYLSGISNSKPDSFNGVYMSSVKIIEEDRFDVVPYDILQKYMDDLYKKFYINNKEYDIPYMYISEAKELISKISRFNPISLKNFEKRFEVNLFNNNKQK